MTYTWRSWTTATTGNSSRHPTFRDTTIPPIPEPSHGSDEASLPDGPDELAETAEAGRHTYLEGQWVLLSLIHI